MTIWIILELDREGRELTEQRHNSSQRVYGVWVYGCDFAKSAVTPYGIVPRSIKGSLFFIKLRALIHATNQITVMEG